jgi:hypothetical protein
MLPPSAGWSVDISIVTDDPRLVPPMLSIGAHPEWSGGAASELRVTRVAASLRELCVQVAQPAGPVLYVAVDTDPTPWQVLAVVIFEAGVDEEPRITYEGGGYFEADLCRAVLIGTPVPFPPDPLSIKVTGGISDPAQIAAVQEALHRMPGSFGIEPDGAPEISLRPIQDDDRPVDQVCYEGIVYQGGPRSKVILGLRGASDAWQFQSVRIVEMALRTPGLPEPGEC